MIEIDNQDSYCPICYEILDTENFFTFIHCNHKLCLSCANEIMFQEIVQCPLDRKVVSSIKELNSFKTVQQYREDKCLTDIDFVLNKFQTCWYDQYHEIKNIFTELILAIKNLLKFMKETSVKQNNLTSDEINNMRNSILNVYSMMSNFNYCPKPIKLKSIMAVIEEHQTNNIFKILKMFDIEFTDIY